VDWWGIYHGLMTGLVPRTREEVGRMTLNDLRVIARETAPPVPGAYPSGPIKSMADYKRAVERQR
jgi:hypothetical protein